MENADRLPPQNLDVERAVLGACFLQNPDTIDRVAVILKPEHFYHTPHRYLCRSILAIHSQGAMVDQVSVSTYLQRIDKLDRVGGVSYVAEIAGEMATGGNAEYHARIVLEAYQKRHIITTASQVYQEAHEPSADINDLLSRLGNLADDVDVADASRGATLGESYQEALEYYEWAREHPGELLGLPTGIPELDRLTAGFQDTDLILIAARPGEGKTSLAVWTARAMAQAKPGVIFNLEMSKRQVGSRFITAETGLIGSELRRGRMSASEYKALKQAQDTINALPITVYDDVYQLDEIVSLARHHKRTDDIGWIQIDYLQLVRSARKNNDNREQQIAQISSTLKGLAKDLGIPVIALSQLSRLMKGEKIRKPKLDDLRESGALEQDANVVIFPFRPYVHGQEYWERDDGTKLDLSQYAQIIIGKQREGELGKFSIRADMSTGQWTEWDESEWIITPLTPGTQI